MTVKEAASELRCSISFIYKLMDSSEIAYERRGRRKLPVASSVAEYRDRNMVPARSPEEPSARPKGAYRFRHLFA